MHVFRQDRDIEPEDFQRYTEKVQTSLQDCPVQSPPAALLSRHREQTSRAKQGPSHKVKQRVIIWGLSLVATIRIILTFNKYRHRLARRCPAYLWAWWNWRVTTRNHMTWTSSHVTSPQVPEQPAKPSTTAVSPTAGSTTKTSQTPSPRGTANKELFTSNLKVKCVSKAKGFVFSLHV